MFGRGCLFVSEAKKPNDADDAPLVGHPAEPRLNDAHDAHLVAVACPTPSQARAQMMLMMMCAWWAILWQPRPHDAIDARLGNDARLHDVLLRASQWPNDAHDACLVAVVCPAPRQPKPNDADDAGLVGHCGQPKPT